MSLFPFTAIVGMEQAKKSLIYHALDPRLGGTLLLGHRGCAKSTLVRAFAALLRSDDGKPAPFCEVPLGITEDRLLGSVDPESLVEKHQWQTRIGLLEKAHQGILYIDEVNLLPDHLSDLILDSAASGIHRLERDGITRVVESRYVLVGTMNPEEGELRPQLLDRFAHGVRIRDDFSEEERVEIVQRRLAFDDAPAVFQDRYRQEEERLRERIQEARARLKRVVIRDEQRREIARRGSDLKVEGMRAELAVMRTARGAAAWDSRNEVSTADIEEAWAMCLGHRQDEVRPPSPQPPPPRPERPERTSASSPRSQSGGSSSPAPLHAREQSIELRAAPANPSMAFSNWWDHREKPVEERPGPGHSVHTTSKAPIAWLASLLASAQIGWLSGNGSFRLHRSRLSKKRSLWIFLDASRSTGMTGFLSKANALLQAANRLRIDCRVHILLLRENRVRWLCRNQGWPSACRALAEVTSASGGSHLAEAMMNLNRAMLRKRHTVPWAMIFTDGLNRRLAHETTTQSITRMRFALQRIQATTLALARGYPKPRPGMAHLSQRLFAGFQGTRLPL
jgi:Mg-chelatase subunit ChlI